MSATVPLAIHHCLTPSPVAMIGFVVVWYTAPQPPVHIRVICSDRCPPSGCPDSVRKHRNILYRGAACDLDAKMMLGDDFNSEMIFLHFNIRILAYGSHQTALDFCTRRRHGAGCGIRSVHLRGANQICRPAACRNSHPSSPVRESVRFFFSSCSTAARSLMKSPAIIVSSICLSKLSISNL